MALVKKAYEKWKICVDYTGLNIACPKESYPIPSIDNLVDKLADYKLLLFMDAYSSYSQIPTYGSDKENMIFMTEHTNYQYNDAPFYLKNKGEMYHRMMNKVFTKEICETLEVTSMILSLIQEK